jgi:hypothetical protein
VGAPDAGVALMAREGDAPGLERAVAELLDPDIGARITMRCGALPAADGARQAADVIAALEAPTRSAPRRDGRLRRISRALRKRLRRRAPVAPIRYTLVPVDALSARGSGARVVELAMDAPTEAVDRLWHSSYQRRKRAILTDAYGGEPEPW